MSFPPFTEEHDLFRKTVRSFVARELTPHAREWDDKKDFPNEIFTQMGELGFLGLRHPEESGGAGLDYWYTVAFLEELTYSRCAGVNMAIAVQSDMATPVLSELGSDEIKKEFVEPAVAGEKIAALGVTEPGCGSDVSAIRTTARRDGEDIHHQRRPGRLHHPGRAHRREGLRRHQLGGPPLRHQGLHRGAQAGQDRQPCLRHH